MLKGVSYDSMTFQEYQYVQEYVKWIPKGVKAFLEGFSKANFSLVVEISTHRSSRELPGVLKGVSEGL